MERKFHTLEQSKELIAPIYEEVVDCIRNSFADFITFKNVFDEKAGFVEFQKRTKACIIHDLIKGKITNSFSTNPTVTIGTFNKVFGIVLNDDLFLRFKKMDKDYKVSSLKTKQHKKFMNQHQIEGFPETPTFLFAGYIPNATWTDLDGIYLACWNGDILEWYDEAGNYSYEQSNFDFQTNADTDLFEVKGDKLTLKEGLKKKKETGTN
ncbi:hypothetical protein VS868_03270 [Salinimicrobium sp. 3283s]|uniref:hypothetical protein n=1 Tax=Salinimicrobium sp. 3283s TaxID=3114359 RepID=UPI0031EA9161